MDAADPGLLLSIREAARLLGQPERRLYRWAAEGHLPLGLVVRLGRAVYLSRPRLLDWLGVGPGGQEVRDSASTVGREAADGR